MRVKERQVSIRRRYLVRIKKITVGLSNLLLERLLLMA